MVSDTRKEKLFFDIIKSLNITYQRKGASLMNISISQNFKNVLKNKIKILISPILYKSIDFIVDNLFEINNPDKYFYFMNTIQSSVKELIKNIVITAFEELDNNFKNSNNLSFHVAMDYDYDEPHIKKMLTQLKKVLDGYEKILEKLERMEKYAKKTGRLWYWED